MLRARLASLKGFLLALFALVILVCGLEVGLRVYDSYCRRLPNSSENGIAFVAESWLTHHQLKPLQEEKLENPDSHEKVVFRTNSFGLRGGEIAVPKPPGIYRIICLGDETTLAPRTAERDTFSARLQNLLRTRFGENVEVINAGVPEYCPLLSYLQVRHTLAAIEPDMFLLHFDMSDVADDHRCRRYVHMSEDQVPLACPHPRLALRAAGEGQQAERFLIPGWVKQQLCRIPGGAPQREEPDDIDSPRGRYAWLRDNPPDWSVYIRQALRPIEDLERIANNIGARLIVATYPKPWQVSASASSGPGVRESVGVPRDAVYTSNVPFRILSEFLDRRGIPFLDTSPAFIELEEASALFMTNAGRFSPSGHALYARHLAEFVLETTSVSSGRRRAAPLAPTASDDPFPPRRRDVRSLRR